MLYLFVGLLLNSSGAFALTEVLGDSLDQVISSVYLSDARCLSLSAIATSRITGKPFFTLGGGWKLSYHY